MYLRRFICPSRHDNNEMAGTSRAGQGDEGAGGEQQETEDCTPPDGCLYTSPARSLRPCLTHNTGLVPEFWPCSRKEASEFDGGPRYPDACILSHPREARRSQPPTMPTRETTGKIIVHSPGQPRPHVLASLTGSHVLQYAYVGFRCGCPVLCFSHILTSSLGSPGSQGTQYVFVGNPVHDIRGLGP
jgi:hypothetical protein